MSISNLEKKQLEAVVAETGVLDLSYRELSEVPSFVWKLSSLRVLRLDHNVLEGHLRLPKDINVPLLQRLDLSHNRITRVPKEFANFADPHFEMLDLSFNQLTELPIEFRVFFFKSELQIAGYYKNIRGVSATFRNKNWGGWHNKLPTPGYRMVYSGRRFYNLFFDLAESKHPEFRIAFYGNTALETSLRASLKSAGDDAKFEVWDLIELFGYASDGEEKEDEVESESGRTTYLETKPMDAQLQRRKRDKNRDKQITRERLGKMDVAPVEV